MPSSCSASTLNTQQLMRGGLWVSLIHGPHRSSPGLTLIQYVSLYDLSALVIFNMLIRRVLFVFSGPDDEAKLFLWWHKALGLSVEQLQPQAGQSEVLGVVMGLMRLQTRLLQLGEERLNSGLLGAIGLGKRSPVSNRWAQVHFICKSNHLLLRQSKAVNKPAVYAFRFRVVVRSLAAFLSIQVPSETELRLQPTSDLQLSAKAQQVCTKNCNVSIF